MVDDAQRYSELNERSRFYTRHIWQVPFAYVAIIAWAIEKLPNISPPLRGVVAIGLGVFTMSVLVFVTHMKYYERRAVASLQELEQDKKGKAGGGSPWFISFPWYVRLMLVFAVYAFFIVGSAYIFCAQYRLLVGSLVALLLTIPVVYILRYDWIRSKPLIDKIRNAME